LKNCRAQPGCEERLRSIATALAFYLEHDLDYATELGFSPSVYAAHMCCGVFGRDEGGSELKFTPKNVEHLLTKWRLLIQGQGHMSSFTPTADTIMVLELVISDVNKPLLIDNKDFLPYLVDALLLVSTSTLDAHIPSSCLHDNANVHSYQRDLSCPMLWYDQDPDHPRAGMKEELKVWCQTTHAECFAQLAVCSEGRKALRRAPLVSDALRALAQDGLSMEAKQHAASALLALSDTEPAKSAEGQKHVMLSCECALLLSSVSCLSRRRFAHLLSAGCGLAELCCVLHHRTDQWDVQATIQRVNDLLIARGYITWFDLSNMKGMLSTLPRCTSQLLHLPAHTLLSTDSVDTAQDQRWTPCPKLSTLLM